MRSGGKNKVAQKLELHLECKNKHKEFFVVVVFLYMTN